MRETRKKEKKDGRKDGWTDRPMDGQTDGWTDRQEGRKDG